jgi:RNA-binding protein
MRLTEEQIEYLAHLGHERAPVVHVGAGGLTNSVVKQIHRALDDQELVKVNVPFGTRERREQLFAELGPLSGSLLVKRTGRAALLYRPATEPQIKLPAAGTAN